MRPKTRNEYEPAAEQQPPLSGRDKAILLTTGVVGMALAFGLEGLWQRRTARLALLEPGTLAAVETAACFWMLPGFILAFGMGLFGFAGFFGRYALFGLPGAVYQGSSRRDVLGYPLFMDLSEAPESVCRKVRKERRALAGVLAALAVSLCLAPMSWQGRAVLYQDGSLRVYAGTGKVRSQCSAEALERVTVRITPPRSGKYGQAHYELELLVRDRGGGEWVFQEKDLASKEPEEYLSWLAALKAHCPEEALVLENADRVNALIQERGYGAEELWLLYELYGLVGQVLS